MPPIRSTSSASAWGDRSSSLTAPRSRRSDTFRPCSPRRRSGARAAASRTAAELAERARKLGRGSDPLVRQKIAQHTIEARALQLNGYRAVTAVKRSGVPGPEGSILKLMWSELNQRMTETAMDMAGSGAQVGDGDGWKYQFLRSRANTIEAGTSEVLRNILAERVLGLPRSR